MGIKRKIKKRLLSLKVSFHISKLNHLNRMKSLIKRPQIFFENTYTGKKIVLLALYEKGTIRPDIENLIRVAKAQGAYILGINTLKLTHPEKYKDLFDCYIERYNFGRDFGSYKLGLNHIFQQQWDKECPRLLLLNDSVFYSKKNLRGFIKNLLTTEVEVLGATENHEINHHLGSFCISISNSVIKNLIFKEYWKNYSNSDIRPIVISQGEMKLSKLLRKCVSSPDNLSVLFDLSWLSNYLNNNKEILNNISDFYHTQDFYNGGKQRQSLQAVAARLINHYLQLDPSLLKGEMALEKKIETGKVYFVNSPEGIVKSIDCSTKETDIDSIRQRVYEEIKNNLLEHFAIGSQIHHNAILLHHLGLPLIKCDGLYRGMFSITDIVKISEQLSADEAPLFKRLMFSKPFGATTLRGWKKTAFLRGFI